MQDDVFPVVVIGAGLAGLTAALHLADRDIPPLVLEADTEWPGGRLAGGAPETFEYEGRTWSFSSQHGIHALWGSYDNMRAVLDRYIEIELRPSEGEEWINRWGLAVRAIEAGTAVRKTWLPAPFHYLQLLLKPHFWRTITPLDFISLPGFLISLIWTTGLDPIREQVALDGLMMNEFFRGWTPNLRATFTGLGHSMLAAPSEAITLTGFIAAMRFYTMLRRDSWYPEYLPSNSHDCLIQPMVDKIKDMGGMLFYGSRAEQLSQNADGTWQIRIDDARLGGKRTLIAQNVILAVDPPAAQKILAANPRMAAQVKRIPPGLENAAVRMWFSKAPRPGAPGGMFTGDFTIDNFFWLHRMHDEFAEWHTVTGGSALETHLYSPPAQFRKDDRMLLVEATAEVYRAFPELRGHFVHGSLRRNGPTQSQFLVPTAESLHVDTPWEGVYACGDWIGYDSPSLWMERCCVTGIAAANHVLHANDRESFELIPPREPEMTARLLGGLVRAGRRVLSPVIMGSARRLRRSSSDESNPDS